MLDIKDLEVYNLENSIVASGFAMSTGELAEDFEHQVKCVENYLLNYDTSHNYTTEDLIIGKKHFDRAVKLGNTPSSSGHGNLLTGIRVSFNLKYPEYISPELQRYHWIDIVTSNGVVQ